MATRHPRRRPRISEEMAIRGVVAGDRDLLLELVGATENLSADEKDCAAELLDIYLNDPLQEDYRFLAAFDRTGRPAGYVCYGKASLTDAAYDMYWILVAPSMRSKGIGARLLGRTEELLRQDGARLLIAETSSLPSYEAARGFYLKSGFKEEARIREFYKPGDDKVIYIKRF